MIIYKPLNLKFANRLEAKRYFGQSEFNKLMKNPDNFTFIKLIKNKSPIKIIILYPNILDDRNNLL